ncbi:MAG: methyl-accepting chemotaxis protein [Phycisphaerae bacterium]|nr:methyl-accepting chemotaxis protein [Phycisphaerae bacterium]
MTGYLKTQHGLEDHRQKMNETAATYMSNCQAFLAGQQERMKKELKEEGADLDERLEKITLCSTIIDTGNEVRVLSFKSQAAGEPKYMQEALEKLKGTKKLTAALRGITRDDTDIQRIDATEEAADGYYAAMEGFLKDYLSLGDYRKSMDETAGTYVKNCNDFLASQYAALQGDMLERMKKIHLVSDIVNMGNGVRLGCFKAQALRDPVLFQKVQNDFGAVNEKYEALSAITRNEVNIKQIAATKAAGEAYGKAMTEFLANWNKAQDLNRQRTTVGSEVLALTQETSNAGMTETDKIAQEASASLSVASTTMIVGLAVAVVIGCLLAFFITRGITKPLNRIITGMNEGADQVNDAAGQVSTASQQLAEGASEQASSLEETSSALEQMAAMTRTNAENAKQANNLSGQARNAAQSGDKTMHKLNEAMTGINESSGKISKIIKVIEEIAFQTNLLALNAAVEAARAGEHGKGFAVVADEVRNLAQRAAQAARETTGLIEDSVNKAKEGTEVAGEVGKALGAIVGDVTKVTDLIDGITKASEEQAQGVDQVNTAVGQMDKVTQQNAAGAEESASAAEEMAAQAQAVKGMVDELSAMVGGKSTKRATTPTTSSTYKAKKQHKVQVAHLKKKELHTASVGAPAGGREETSAAAKGGLSDDEFMGPDDKNGLSEF